MAAEVSLSVSNQQAREGERGWRITQAVYLSQAREHIYESFPCTHRQTWAQDWLHPAEKEAGKRSPSVCPAGKGKDLVDS